MEEFTTWWSLGVVGVCTVLWWLIRQRDTTLNTEITDLECRRKADSEMLWQKHDDDVRRLQDVELDIARRHYVKEELDDRFDRIERSINNGMESLCVKMDRLSDALLKHITEEK